MKFNNTKLMMNTGQLSIDNKKVGEIMNIDIELVNKSRFDIHALTKQDFGMQIYTISIITKKTFWERIKRFVRRFL